GIRDRTVTGVQTCALPIYPPTAGEGRNKAADPANLVAPVPLAMHRAAELVASHRPSSMTIAEADRLVEALQAPYPERILKLIREIGRASCRERGWIAGAAG